MPAHLFFVERDSAAFRSLVAKVCGRETYSVAGSLTAIKTRRQRSVKLFASRILLSVGYETWGFGHLRRVDGR